MIAVYCFNCGQRNEFELDPYMLFITLVGLKVPCEKCGQEFDEAWIRLFFPQKPDAQSLEAYFCDNSKAKPIS